MKHSLKYGLMAGFIMVISWWLGQLIVDPFEQMELSQVLGYAAMLLAIVAVFLGVKNKRDSDFNGTITFGKAFKVGLNIVLVASAVYVIGWMVYYPNFMPDFMDQYATTQMQSYRDAGLSADELATKQQELDRWLELYENPFIMAGMTFMEFFPVGLLGTLISAFILKKK